LTPLLALAVVTGLLEMVNALALAVIERTREIGALRAVGMTRRQTRRIVRTGTQGQAHQVDGFRGGRAPRAGRVSESVPLAIDP